LVGVLNQQLAAGATYVFPNASVLDFRLGIMRTEAGKKPPLTGGPSMLSLYGITGLPTDPTITGGLTTQTITGFSQLGRQATNPQFQNPSNVDPRINYSWAWSRHSPNARRPTLRRRCASCWESSRRRAAQEECSQKL
jgi:hypothetical protein